jgi:hypothetical protein
VILCITSALFVLKLFRIGETYVDKDRAFSMPLSSLAGLKKKVKSTIETICSNFYHAGMLN